MALVYYGRHHSPYGAPTYFRLFTKESLTKINRRIAEEKAARELARDLARELEAGGVGGVGGGSGMDKKVSPPLDEERLQPNPSLEVGRTLPSRLGEFPPELFGKPIEDVDQYYHNKYTFMVVAKDRTIFRFSATNALFIFSPFNPVRRVAIYILTHPFFSLFVMLVILINCAFMAVNQDIPKSEEAFTGIYTIEGTVKLLARGFILADFTYLRDAWNWLDFVVVTLAYITMSFPVGNLAALRTFRVLRALKTVAVVPGLKTIVGALLEAVRRLRDVMILSVFVLSIFALVGLQLYSGSLMRKCVADPDRVWELNQTEKDLYFKSTNSSLWIMQNANDAKLCGPSEDAGQCPANYSCVTVGINPNYGFTNFDNFGFALLCAFRLMTQDCWENLYQQVIRANGRPHMLFFIIVIFMGSFYLVNLILAIVAMSYDDCQKKDMEEAEEEADEDEDDEQLAMEETSKRLTMLEEAVMRRSPSNQSCTSLDEFIERRVRMQREQQRKQTSDRSDTVSMQSERCIDVRDRRRCSFINNAHDRKVSSSLPGSPSTVGTNGLTRQFGWRRKLDGTGYRGYGAGGRRTADGRRGRPPLVTPCLDNLDLPYADDDDATATSQATAPSGLSTASSIRDTTNHIRSSSCRRTAFRRSLRMSVRNRTSSSGGGGGGGGGTGAGGAGTLTVAAGGMAGTRRSSQPYRSRALSQHVELSKWKERRGEPTHFRWDASIRIKRRRTSDAYIKRKSIGSPLEPPGGTVEPNLKDLLFADNPFVCQTPSTTVIDMQDVLVLKDLINHASGKKGFLAHEGLWKEYLRSKCMQLLFGWDCCPGWYRFAHLLELIIMDAFVDLFITLCIVINTVFMAMETGGMSPGLANTLSVGNYVFTTIFATEAIFKILALGLITYLKDKWNCFDVIIVILSLVELGLSNVKGLSILRSFRLLRVFKLAKSWPTLNLLIGIIGRTMGALGNLCFVLAIIVFIFAVMGMQLFGNDYNEKHFPQSVPRWNFTDFLHSFMIVFRVLCGEWIESMWDCIHCSSFVCVPFFLLTMIIGNLVVLNLFLALLLSSFGAESFQHSQEDSETNKLQEAVDRINRLFIHAKSRLRSCINVCTQHNIKLTNGGGSPGSELTSKTSSGGAVYALQNKIYRIHNNGTSAGPLLSNGPRGPRQRLQGDTCLTHSRGSSVCCVHSHQNSVVDIPQLAARHMSVVESMSRDGYSPVSLIEPIDTADVNQCRQLNLKLSPTLTAISQQQLRQQNPEQQQRQPQQQQHQQKQLQQQSTVHPSRRRVSNPQHLVSSSSVFSLDSSSSSDDSDDDVTISVLTANILSGAGSVRAGGGIGGTGGVDDETVSNGDKPTSVLEGPEVNEVKVVFVKYPDDCCPLCCSRRGGSGGGTGVGWREGCCCPALERSIIGRTWWTFRCGMYRIVEHRYFESFIILMIIASSLSLAMEDKDVEDNHTLKHVLKTLDKTFSIIFVFEMVIKWSAYGFKKYFTDAWCWLDFIIVLIALISMVAEGAEAGNMGAFRALRTLRALRPLRAVSRWEGMKVVVNALIQAIPAIFNVLLVCLVFWLIFSIMGVNLFGGRFESCVDGNNVILNVSIVANKSECLARSSSNYTWHTPKINFDNVLMAYLALFQVATFKGWMAIMSNAIDSREPHQQPEREARSGMYLYFVFFIVFGSFFTLNLFIGVIIDNFNMQKKKMSGSLEMFMTEDQKKYYNAMKKLGSKQPQKPIPKPKVHVTYGATIMLLYNVVQYQWQIYFFDLSSNQKFDIGIMIVILLNMMTMAVEHENQPQELENVLNYVNIIFVAIFTLECVTKLIALRWYFFKQPWNVFDFIVVVVSILGLAMTDIIAAFVVSPTLLRVVRVFRIGRILRLVKSAKGIRTLLFSLAVSLPALFNIGLLLFLVMFIYAIFGMSFFMHVKHTDGIDDIFNFECFSNSMILLFQVSTSAGWDGVLSGLMNDQAPSCNDTWTELRPNGDCGSTRIAVVFLVTYLVISFLVVINMYIAVILENFSQATEDVQQGLTQDDFDMYYEIWERFDEKASQYIPLSKVSEFVDVLEAPLRIQAPNFYRLVALDITICEDDRVHCVDILEAVARYFLSAGGETGTDLGDFRKGPPRKDYRPISSTLKRQREIYCAHVIQTAWRAYCRNRGTAQQRVRRDTGDMSTRRQRGMVTNTAARLDSIPESSSGTLAGTVV